MKKYFVVFLLSIMILACDANTIPPGQTRGSGQKSAAVSQTTGVDRQIIQRTQSAVGTIRPH